MVSSNLTEHVILVIHDSIPSHLFPFPIKPYGCYYFEEFGSTLQENWKNGRRRSVGRLNCRTY